MTSPSPRPPPPIAISWTFIIEFWKVCRRRCRADWQESLQGPIYSQCPRHLYLTISRLWSGFSGPRGYMGGGLGEERAAELLLAALEQSQ